MENNSILFSDLDVHNYIKFVSFVEDGILVMFASGSIQVYDKTNNTPLMLLNSYDGLCRGAVSSYSGGYRFAAGI
jgi:hypothetical protein